MNLPTRKQAHAWEQVEDIMVTMTAVGEISDELWAGYWDIVRKSNVRIIVALVVGEASVSSPQRKLAADVMNEKGLPAIVVTDSRLTRGVLTALSWLGAKIQAFSWKNIEPAVETISPSPAAHRRIVAIANEFIKSELK